MNKVARFSKVSFEQFKNDLINVLADDQEITETHLEQIKKWYDEIQLPTRKTTAAAGYDFAAPFKFILAPNEDIVIPTGIRCLIDDGWFLSLFPRSGHGFKNHVKLANTVGIIDADYTYSDNEGHIMVKLVNGPKRPLEVEQGAGFCQGILLAFGLTYTDEDDKKEIRNGGFGSTSK